MVLDEKLLVNSKIKKKKKKEDYLFLFRLIVEIDCFLTSTV